MTTRRERLENKLEKREEWADKARDRSAARFDTVHNLAGQIPLGQPVLVGHHSEKRHRRHLAKMDSNMAKGCEEQDKAKHHASKADGLERQLETNIFSDDADAIEQIREKIAKLEAKRDWAKRLNAAWRKAKKPAADDIEGWTKVASLLGWDGDAAEGLRISDARLNLARDPMDRAPYPPYVGTNLSGNIGRYKKRIQHIERMRERSQAADDAGGVSIEGQDWVSVTFAEKPARAILTALKAAGFRWSSGSWHGKCEDLPAEAKGNA